MKSSTIIDMGKMTQEKLAQMMAAGFSEVNGRIDRLESHVNDEFGRVSDEFRKVHHEFSKVHGSISELRSDMQNYAIAQRDMNVRVENIERKMAPKLS